ncbi:MAG: PCP reductase family protein [Nitrospirota bacterium]
MMGRMGGEAGLAAAADQIEKGKVPWTAAAQARLETVPEFMRHMIKQIAEELALERGHLEVNIELFEKVEALGDLQEQAGPPMEWTDGARARLQEKIKNAPPIAMDFVTDMLKRDTEDQAREKGLARIDEAALVQLWDAPQERVLWTDEAWKRLLTSPDFVRSGIRKAAERRARKMGLKEIDSEHLTKFRNEAMMKAVKRIRSFGYRELTFDAFEDALEKVKRLQGNEQAEKRLAEIRAYMKQKPDVGVLGEELMERFRKYLKGEGTL